LIDYTLLNLATLSELRSSWLDIPEVDLRGFWDGCLTAFNQPPTSRYSC